MPSSSSETSSTHGRGFWIALACGAALMTWGAVLYAQATPDAGRRWALALWLVGLDVGHDLVIAPAVCVLGMLLVRPLAARWRAPTRAGLLGTATVLLLAWLPLRDSAAVSGNPTIQPIDQPTATATAIALVWLAVLFGVVLERARAACVARGQQPMTGGTPSPAASQSPR